MMSVEPGILDANVLDYGFNADAPHHAASLGLIDAARDPLSALYVTSQILCEFYSVITNPRRVAIVRSPTQALLMLSALLALPGMHMLPIPARAVTGWMDLLKRHPVKGANIFDLQIVATMLANGINRIYTFNSEDFKVFPELIVVTPRTA